MSKEKKFSVKNKHLTQKIIVILSKQSAVMLFSNALLITYLINLHCFYLKENVKFQIPVENGTNHRVES